MADLLITLTNPDATFLAPEENLRNIKHGVLKDRFVSAVPVSTTAALPVDESEKELANKLKDELTGKKGPKKKTN